MASIATIGITHFSVLSVKNSRPNPPVRRYSNYHTVVMARKEIKAVLANLYGDK